MIENTKKYSLDELASLTGLTARTIRYYIQKGLVDRPIGERRGAHYSAKHLEQLLRVRRLTQDGFSLERIGQLAGQEDGRAPGSQPPGTVTVRSHVHIADGIELVVDPAASRLDTATLRTVVAAILGQLETVLAAPPSEDGGQR